MEELKEALLERFLRYVQVPSESVGGAGKIPSSEGQWDMAHLLEKECRELGLVDIFLSEACVLYAHLPANLPAGKTAPAMGFVAHLDTVNVNLSPVVKPQVIHYEGGDVTLNAAEKIVMRAAEHPELSDYVGQDIVFTDGTSVLGADNKAAIANIMTAVHHLVAHPEIPHGDIYLAFVPDEEIGLVGAKQMDFSKFPVEFAYTIDCCALGEAVYETFNAGAAKITIHGVSAHPMSAKGVLVNPTLIAVDFANLFDRKETPECTEGKEGYIWVQEIHSNQSTATVFINIRDHDKERYEARKKEILFNVEKITQANPRAKISCAMEDVYGNIADAVTEDNRQAIDNLFAAMQAIGVTPHTIAMRGGTDGSFISTKGILTPNYFTGALNFHSRFEFLPLPSIEKSCEMTLKLIALVTEK